MKLLYYNDHEKNVFKKVGDDITTLNKRKSVNESTEGLRVVVSRSHMSEETSDYVNKLIKPKLISCGSSLKFLYIADNRADICKIWPNHGVGYRRSTLYFKRIRYTSNKFRYWERTLLQ